MNKATMLTLSIAAVVLGGLLASSNAYAYRSDPAIEGPYHTEEREASMEKAFDSNDYNAWKNLMQGRGRVTQVVNQSNFAQFAKAHQLAEEGKIQEANQIRAELGLGLQNGNGQGMGRYAR